MGWDLDFISEEDFKKHVQETIMKYGEKLKSYDLKRFNSNLIDPIKLIFDKSKDVKFHKKVGMLSIEIQMEYKCQMET